MGTGVQRARCVVDADRTTATRPLLTFDRVEPLRAAGAVDVVPVQVMPMSHVFRAEPHPGRGRQERRPGALDVRLRWTRGPQHGRHRPPRRGDTLVGDVHGGAAGTGSRGGLPCPAAAKPCRPGSPPATAADLTPLAVLRLPRTMTVLARSVHIRRVGRNTVAGQKWSRRACAGRVLWERWGAVGRGGCPTPRGGIPHGSSQFCSAGRRAAHHGGCRTVRLIRHGRGDRICAVDHDRGRARFATTNGDILVVTKINGAARNLIAFGGSFSKVITPDGVSRDAKNFAVVDEFTGELVYGGNANNYARAITSLNGTVYVGGDFTSFGGAARSRARRSMRASP